MNWFKSSVDRWVLVFEAITAKEITAKLYSQLGLHNLAKIKIAELTVFVNLFQENLI
jgi:hypothetical protein